VSSLPRPADGSGSEAGGRWLPAVLPDGFEGEVRYLVVDEIVGGAVGLALSAWPNRDAQGRLRFDTSSVQLIGCGREDLQAFLRKHREPGELRQRQLRIGDVFAVRVRPQALEEVAELLEEPRRLEPFLAPERWIEPPIFDLTADARDEAKTAFYAAVAPTLEAEEAAHLLEAEPGYRVQ
jgi:hypothetical protein